jgi:hypothetical protein
MKKSELRLLIKEEMEFINNEDSIDEFDELDDLIDEILENYGDNEEILNQFSNNLIEYSELIKNRKLS